VWVWLWWLAFFGTLVGFDRHRAFYPTVLIVIASYYGLFAVMGGSVHALVMESAIIAIFVLAAVVGFKFSLWMVVGALVAHGIFDLFTATLFKTPACRCGGRWFCLTYDCTAAAYLAWLLLRAGNSQRPRQAVTSQNDHTLTTMRTGPFSRVACPACFDEEVRRTPPRAAGLNGDHSMPATPRCSRRACSASLVLLPYPARIKGQGSGIFSRWTWDKC